MAIAPAAADSFGFTPEQERVISKVLWRVVPFLLVCYIVAYLDRVNVGVAGLTMTHDLGLSPSQFGWSAGLFFFGYFWPRCRATSPCRRSVRASRSLAS